MSSSSLNATIVDDVCNLFLDELLTVEFGGLGINDKCDCGRKVRGHPRKPIVALPSMLGGGSGTSGGGGNSGHKVDVPQWKDFSHAKNFLDKCEQVFRADNVYESRW